MKIQNIFIVGSGLMGSGIAQVFAQAGMSVILSDEDQQALQKAQNNIAWSVGKLVEKGRLKEPQETIIERIQLSVDLKDADDADLVVEAVFEDLDLKQDIFSRLDKICGPDAYFASNTSSLPITELGAATGRPERVLGLHFFNPVPMMKAVEVIRGVSTSEETMQMGTAMVRKLGKEPIRVESDLPGFLLNRINLVSYVEAVRLLEKGVATAEDIDKGVRLAFGRPMGPFETGDIVGLDISFNALTSIYQKSREERYHPPRLLREKVKAGQLGRKSGQGWYRYDENGRRL